MNTNRNLKDYSCFIGVKTHYSKINYIKQKILKLVSDFFQRKVLSEIVFKKWDAAILLGDANLLSHWLFSIIAKIKGVPVIFWGHGMYGNETGLKKLIRKFLRHC
jgi:hypothetical protein